MAETKKREIKYEVIRIIAMIFVITIHQLDKFKPQFTNPIQHQLLSIIFLTCNGLFFMLSGKFALNFNYEEKGCYKKYYLSKFIKIIIPALFYMAIKELYLMHFTFGQKITLSSFLRAYILSVAEGYIVTEYWFVYYLIANLLVAPFVARIFRKLTNKEFYLFFVIALLSNALSVYTQWTGHVFAVPFYLSGMNLYFFLGYFIDKISSTKKQKTTLVILGILSYILTFICLQKGQTINIFDVAPTMTFVVCMIYILIRDGIKIKRIEKPILILGKYSFSIYLLHVIMMDAMTWIFPYNKGMPISLYVILKVTMILISSLVVAILIDNTIIKLIKKLVIKIVEIIEENLTKNRKRKRLTEGRKLQMNEKKKIFKNDLIFYIAICLLPFENFWFAPSQGWATVTPIVLAIYILANFKIFIKEIIKFRKMIVFFICAMALTIINYFSLGFELVNTINALISLGLGFVSLFSFDIYYTKNRDLKRIEKFLFVSYLIAIGVGVIQFITIKLNIQIFYDFCETIFKRNYLGLNRIQYFFTEPSFIGMHIFGILLPIYFINKNKKILGIIIVFSATAIFFASGVRILLDICVVSIILILGFLIRNKKYKVMIIIPLVLLIAFSVLYNINYRARKIVDEGIYADGSLATRYFRIQSSIYGYTKNPLHFIVGYGMGNAIIPLLEGYDDAIVTYRSSYVSEVLGLAEPGFKDDSVSYCLYIRFISEFGIILFVISSLYILKITQNSNFNYKYTYLSIILYLYVQFESYAFYSIWMFILVMLYTANKKEKNKVLVGYVENGISGGIDKYLLNFLNAIDTKKYQIDFITKNYNKEMHELLKKKNCNLFEVSHNRNPIKQYRQMKKIINNGQYEVAYFNISETYNCIGIIAAKMSGTTKIVVHSHSSGSDKGSNVKRKIAEILNLICKPIVHICSNQKVACSKKAAEWLYTKGVVKKENYSIVYNAIEVEKFKLNDEARNAIRTSQKLEGKFIIGHVGRFTYQKNHEFLLEIFKEVSKDNQNAVLVCIGDGENFDAVKKYAEELEVSNKVIFTGNVNNVNEYMQAFDMFVLPSRFEGLPIVGVEAQLSGLPCLFSDNISEEVIIAKNSKLLDATDKELWKNEILRVKERKNELLPIAEKYKIEKQKEQFVKIVKVEEI